MQAAAQSQLVPPPASDVISQHSHPGGGRKICDKCFYFFKPSNLLRHKRVCGANGDLHKEVVNSQRFPVDNRHRHCIGDPCGSDDDADEDEPSAPINLSHIYRNKSHIGTSNWSKKHKFSNGHARSHSNNDVRKLLLENGIDPDSKEIGLVEQLLGRSWFGYLVKFVLILIGASYAFDNSVVRGIGAAAGNWNSHRPLSRQDFWKDDETNKVDVKIKTATALKAHEDLTKYQDLKTRLLYWEDTIELTAAHKDNLRGDLADFFTELKKVIAPDIINTRKIEVPFDGLRSCMQRDVVTSPVVVCCAAHFVHSLQVIYATKALADFEKWVDRQYDLLDYHVLCANGGIKSFGIIVVMDALATHQAVLPANILPAQPALTENDLIVDLMIEGENYWDTVIKADANYRIGNMFVGGIAPPVRFIFAQQGINDHRIQKREKRFLTHDAVVYYTGAWNKKFKNSRVFAWHNGADQVHPVGIYVSPLTIGKAFGGYFEKRYRNTQGNAYAPAANANMPDPY